MEKSFSNLSTLLNEPAGFSDENRDFTSLDAWIRCREVKLFFYKYVIPGLPGEENLNLSRQLRKCCISITANIAEGYGRYHFQEGIQYYRIARGSLYELKDHLISCFDLCYINNELKCEGEKLIENAKIF